MIHWTYINPFWKEYKFDIENGSLTNSDMWDNFDSFWEEMEKVFK
jgi:hypothetical protein